MSTTARVALATSWRGGAEAVRRCLVVASAAGLVARVLCGCASAWALSQRIDARTSGRALASVEPGRPAAAERSLLYDETADGDQITVLWWRVLSADLSIAGVPPDPPAGAWFVSQALADRLAAEPALADRYAGAKVIGVAGTAHREELLAHRFLPRDSGPALSELVAAGPGGDGASDTTQALEPGPILLAGLALVLLPGLGLLLAALSPLAPALDRRLRVLHALGAPTRVRVGVAALQAGLAALPGAALGAGTWWVVAPTMDRVPIVGRRVFAGDLALPGTSAAAVAAVVVALAVGASVVRPRARAGNRPVVAVPRRPSPVRLVPLAASIGAEGAGAALRGSVGAHWFLVGVVASTIGVVVASPVLVDLLGAAVQRDGRLTTLLVGRRLRWSAATSVRSLLAVGSLAVLVPVAAAWVRWADQVDPVSRPEVAVVGVHGDLSPGEVEALASRTGSVAVGLALAPPADADPTVAPRASLVGSCGDLARVLPGTTCGPHGFRAPSGPLALGGIARGPELVGFPTPPSGAELESTLFVGRDLVQLDAALRSAVVNGDRPGLQVSTPGRVPVHRSPLVAWLLGGMVIAGAIGALALLLHLAGQAAQIAGSLAGLGRLGADGSVLRRAAAGEAASVVLAVGLGGTVIGTCNSWLFTQVDHHGEVPVAVIGLVVLGVAMAGCVSAATAAASVSLSPRR